MLNRLFIFELKRKQYMIWLIIVFIIANFWLLNSLNRASNISNHQYISILEESSDNNEKQMSIALKNKDYSTFLEHRIDYNSQLINSQSQNLIRNDIEFDKYLLRNHIEPLNMFVDYNHISDVNGATAIYSTIKIVIPFIIPFISFLVVFTSIQDTKKAKTYLLTLPIQKYNIIKAKWLSSIVVSFLCVVLLLLTSFIIGTYFGGIGNFLYPIALNTSVLSDAFMNTYIPLWMFIVFSLFIILFHIIVYASCGVIICKHVENTWSRNLILIVLSVLPLIYEITFPVPLFANSEIPLIPVVSSSPFSIITQGYSVPVLLMYFAFFSLVSAITYRVYLSKKSRGHFYEETT